MQTNEMNICPENISECYVCGKDESMENKIRCETCFKCLHVGCLNISIKDKILDKKIIWICICGESNLSTRLYDAYGIPIDFCLENDARN